jgi:hypothetical protein
LSDHRSKHTNSAIQSGVIAERFDRSADEVSNLGCQRRLHRSHGGVHGYWLEALNR